MYNIVKLSLNYKIFQLYRLQLISQSTDDLLRIIYHDSLILSYIDAMKRVLSNLIFIKIRN